MYPAATPIRSPYGSARCDGCRRTTHRPARLLRFEDPEHRRGRFVRLCADCYPHVFLLERPDACRVIRAALAARRAWYRHAGPLLFDQVREGLREPTDLPELVRWLAVEAERQASVAQHLEAELGGTPTFAYGAPEALRLLLAACAEPTVH